MYVFFKPQPQESVFPYLPPPTQHSPSQHTFTSFKQSICITCFRYSIKSEVVFPVHLLQLFDLAAILNIKFFSWQNCWQYEKLPVNFTDATNTSIHYKVNSIIVNLTLWVLFSIIDIGASIIQAHLFQVVGIMGEKNPEYQSETLVT